MKDLFKNIVYAGIGAAFLTRDKIEEAAKQLTEKGCMTLEEGKKFAEDLSKKSESAKEHLEEWISRKVEERVKKCHLASSSEIAELQRKIEELQAALNALNKDEQCRQNGKD